MQWTRVVAALRHRWQVVAIAIVLGLLAGLGATAALAPRYESTSTVFLSLDRGGSATEFNAGSIFALNLVPSYAEVATMPVVLRPVVVELDLDLTPAELASRVSVEIPANTTLLDITVTDASAERAAAIANAIAVRMQDAVAELSPRTEAGGAALRVTTTSPAVPPTRASSVAPTTVVLGATALTALIGIAVALLLETTRRPLRTRAEVTAALRAPVLATVPRDRRAARHPLAVVTQPGRPRTEQLLVLRAAFGLLDRGRPPACVMVCSPAPRDGRTGVAVNLAIALARTSKRVLLIDADVREPRASGLLLAYAGESPGLTAVLRGDSALDVAVCRWADPEGGGTALDVLPAGTDSVGLAALLQSDATRALLERARTTYDVIVIDTAPILPSADTTALATHVERALLVVDARRTRAVDVGESLERLQAAGTRVVGAVLNRSEGGFRSRLIERRRSRTAPAAPAPAAGATANGREAVGQDLWASPGELDPSRTVRLPLQAVSDAPGTAAETRR
jgi:capsular exopolysaccharide synthesis family protein